MNELLALAERVERADQLEPIERELLRDEVLRACGWHTQAIARGTQWRSPKGVAFNWLKYPDPLSSIDAAMSLVPVAPWPWNVTMATAYGSASVVPCAGESTGIHDKRGGHCHGATAAALAMTAAALRARAAMESKP